MKSTIKIEGFKDKKVLVVGDLMLDKYTYGNVTRVSPEAPVQVVRYEREMNVPGGSGNTAMNLASLGCKVYLSGVWSQDHNKEILQKELEKKGINCSGMVIDASRPTIVKERVMNGQYQLIRIDREETHPITKNIEKEIIEKCSKILETADAVIVSDYVKGTITKSLMSYLVELARKNNKIIVVDSKNSNLSMFKGIDLITPNMNEAKLLTGIKDNVQKMGSAIRKALKSHVFITRGKDGISVFNRNGKYTHIPTKVSKVFDVTGAGDTVAAVATLALVSGMSLEEAAELANHAAGIVVQKIGTSTLTLGELKSSFRNEIHEYLKESMEVKQAVIDNQMQKIEEVANHFINAYKNNKKVLAFGNGGSAADAQHLVGELVGRFKTNRNPLSAISLSTDPSVVTCIANDFGFDRVFERQVEANTNKGDIVVGITTSGNSPNVINAMKKAREMGAVTIGLTGKDGGQIASLCDTTIIVPSNNTPRIQEAHTTIIHIICELLDKQIAK